ncbi:hypothetical protein BOTBODRAFT_619998 [Botryobasidium botryosum FD-172 SS1]|uniref:C2H2-type domain-containing protein n=1 Tax=Botryobasidium botryosum (strain FD-172 SS1) TaxID=930990 RepID=A0A067MQM2_BOTB1|nr:hypothetical protein BOTBODRAFT_619998 [Botryobasidium botryosum FD-172 SS1]
MPDPKLACPWPRCPGLFGFPSRRSRHINDVHTRDITFKCPQCHYITTQKGNLKTHRTSQHPIASEVERAMVSDKAAPPWKDQSRSASPGVGYLLASSDWDIGNVKATYTALPEASTDTQPAPSTVSTSTHFSTSVLIQNSKMSTKNQIPFERDYLPTTNTDVHPHPMHYPPATTNTTHLEYGGLSEGDFAGGYSFQPLQYPARDVNFEAQVLNDSVLLAETTAHPRHPFYILQFRGPPESPHKADSNRRI